MYKDWEKELLVTSPAHFYWSTLSLTSMNSVLMFLFFVKTVIMFRYLVLRFVLLLRLGQQQTIAAEKS